MGVAFSVNNGKLQVHQNNDILETSFSASNDVTSWTNITGLSFNNANVRSAEILLSVSIDATGDLFEKFHLELIQTGSGWDFAVTSIRGDDSEFEFNVNSSGNVQYKSGDISGWSSTNVVFKAWTTSV